MRDIRESGITIGLQKEDDLQMATESLKALYRYVNEHYYFDLEEDFSDEIEAADGRRQVYEVKDRETGNVMGFTFREPWECFSTRVWHTFGEAQVACFLYSIFEL